MLSHSANQNISRLLCNVKFIAVYTDACYNSIFWHSETTQHFQIIFLNCHLSLTLVAQAVSSLCVVLLKFCTHFIPTCILKCLSHFILLNLIMWIVFGTVQLWLHSLYIYYPSLYHSFSLSYPNTFLSILSSNAVNVCSSLRVRD